MDEFQQFDSIGFEVVAIDDHDTLFKELFDGSMYMTLTDEDGRIPSNDEEPIIISLFDDNDAFKWSVSLDSTKELEELMNRVDDSEELIRTLEEIRSENIAFFDAQQEG